MRDRPERSIPIHRGVGFWIAEKVLRAHARRIHAREKRTGHFWQGRFGCVAMDEEHLLAARLHVALNPVRARLVARAQDWRWSGVHALPDPVPGDGLTETAPVLARIPDFGGLLAMGEDEQLSGALRRAECIGRPLGDTAFLDCIKTTLGRNPAPRKRGPQPNDIAH